MNPLTVCDIRLHLRIPLTNFADSTYICRFHLHLRIPLTFCGIHLQLRNPELAIMACYRIRDTMKEPTKFPLQVFVRGIHGCFLFGTHLNFGKCLKFCLWNPGTYRHKTVRLTSAQFGLVMKQNKAARISELNPESSGCRLIGLE